MMDVVDDSETGATSNKPEIVKSLSAFHHFSRLQGPTIKADLQANNQDAALGALMTATSQRWKALSEEEAAVYHRIADEDKARYERECRVRDEEVYREQEERRNRNAITETDTRMRGSTLARSDAVDKKMEVAAASSHKRKHNEEYDEKMEERRQAKKDEQKVMKDQHEEIQKKKLEQAEARLQFLLGQSDIFSHFGTGKKSAEAAASPASKPKSQARDRRERGGGGTGPDLDDEELEMMEEEADEEAAAAKRHIGSVALTKQPSVIAGEMRQYQLEGLNWMVRLQDNGINGILADEMGLGKTLQSISLLGYMLEFKKISGPHLIIVPKSTLSNWMNEIARWCPSLRAIRFHGSKEERAVFIDDVLKPTKRADERDWDVCVTTYEISNMEKSSIQKMSWRCLIIDEAHRLKNEASMFSQNIRNCHCEHRLLLTGTPLQNNLHELWALLNFLLPDVFASAEQFDEWFNLDVQDTEAKQRMIGQLHKLLRPFMLRRLKADVEKSLLPKIETILFTGLSLEQKTLYRQILLRDIDTINGGGNNGSRTSVLNIVMQLRKCCNHPYLFPGIEDRSLPSLGDHLFSTCGKMVLLDKLLAKLKQRGHRVLVFTQMTRLMDILEDYFVYRGYEYCRIDGNTTYEDREDRIADYNREGSDKYIFLLSTRAGGLGINLQTADTVILYDSDWNPQADLQAQDRAHRIGQKKQVQVFRLVTENTVEEKVVERAQQKLKLDAMVVQQGRLQEKENKMSKDDLLDTLRFGADKIFRTKDSSDITDADIDVILEEGRKKTIEMNSKMQSADKGDMLDFSLDGGLSTQVFEGKDYSDKALRDNESGIGGSNSMSNFLFIDPGKRERKTIATYSDAPMKSSRDDGVPKQRQLPRHLKLPKMDEWQFYNRARLQEIQDEETRLWESMVERGDPALQALISKIVVLPTDLQEEKTQLLADAFGDWSRMHYSNFIKASAKYGRNNYEKIAEDVHRPVEEVTRYGSVFWTDGPETFGANDWEKIVKQVEKGEKRLEEIDRLTDATGRLIGMFADPWEELCFRHVGAQGRVFHSIEDRYLLCLTHLHGYGNWDRVRSSIRRCERFRFDYYLLSCSAETLGKRCEALMRMAEKELAEMDKKKSVASHSAAGEGAAAAASGTSTVGGNSTAGMRERLTELSKHIAEEARRLALTRGELLKAKGGSSSVSALVSMESNGASAAASSASKSKSATKPRPPADGDATAKVPSVHSGRPAKNLASENIPDLARIVVSAGGDGMAKVVDKFLELYPDVPKRAIENKVFEISTKEKRSSDATKVWHLKPEFEYLLDKKAKSGAESTIKKRKSTDDDGSAGTPVASAMKKKKSDGVNGASPSNPPAKPKRAFLFFVKARRHEAEKELGPDASTDDLKDHVLSKWQRIPDAERKEFEQMEAADQERYNRELEAWEALKAVTA